MSRSLDIPDPVYTALESAAAANGTTPVGWIAAQLQQPPRESTNGANSLADLFQGRTGRIAGRRTGDHSKNSGSDFTDSLVIKRNEGRL